MGIKPNGIQIALQHALEAPHPGQVLEHRLKTTGEGQHPGAAQPVECPGPTRDGGLRPGVALFELIDLNRRLLGLVPCRFKALLSLLQLPLGAGELRLGRRRSRRGVAPSRRRPALLGPRGSRREHDRPGKDRLFRGRRHRQTAR